MTSRGAMSSNTGLVGLELDREEYAKFGRLSANLTGSDIHAYILNK
jgi:hypothetical protein